MNVMLRGHHTSVDEDLRLHAERKLIRIERLLPRVNAAVVEVEHEETRAAKDRFSVRIALHAGAVVLRAEERRASARDALEAAIDVLVGQARRQKQRLEDRHRSTEAKDRTAAAAIPPPPPDPDEDAANEP